MGYKKSFNLVTLQLIIPLSTMTKAEYKNTYGIDLDDIDIEKVTLLQEDGSKNKYFVEEVKTTENGIDIYAGGNILSIGSSVSVVKNAYSVINSKPIYWHGIDMSNSSTKEYFEFHILNNSPEPINTIAKVLAWINSIEGRVVVSGIGSIKVSNVYYTLGIITKAIDNTLSATYNSDSGYTTVGINLNTAFNYVADAVNKIN